MASNDRNKGDNNSSEEFFVVKIVNHHVPGEVKEMQAVRMMNLENELLIMVSVTLLNKSLPQNSRVRLTMILALNDPMNPDKNAKYIPRKRILFHLIFYK